MSEKVRVCVVSCALDYGMICATFILKAGVMSKKNKLA